MKVMSRKDNRCVWVLIPDENVGHKGFHDVLLHDMADADPPYFAVSDLSALRLDWSAVIMSGMTRHQLELEQMRQECKKRYRRAQTGLCTFCGKVIRLDLARHVANYHLELAQLCRCPVSWCTIWKGTPQDCIDHNRLAHAVPATVKAANLGRWFPPWTVYRDTWREALQSSVSGVSTDAPLFSQSGVPLVHRYRVFSQSGTHISLRVKYMTKLRAFRGQADAERQVSHNRDLARSLASRMNPDIQHGVRRREPEDFSPRCKSRRALSPHPTSSDTTRDAVSVSRPEPACACMVGEPFHLRSSYHCRSLLTRTSSQRCFSQCGLQRRSIWLLRLRWPLNLCVLIWMLCRPGTRRRARVVLLLLAR